MDESKTKSDDLSAATDYNSDRDSYFVDDAMPTTTSFECSILREYGWNETTIQQQQQKHIHQRRHSIGDDLFMNNEQEYSMPISERSSSDVGRELLCPSSSSANMRRQLVVEQATTSSNYPSVSSSSSDQDLVEKSICSDDQNPSPNVQIP